MYFKSNDSERDIAKKKEKRNAKKICCLCKSYLYTVQYLGGRCYKAGLFLQKQLHHFRLVRLGRQMDLQYQDSTNRKLVRQI